MEPRLNVYDAYYIWTDAGLFFLCISMRYTKLAACVALIFFLKIALKMHSAARV